MAQIGPCIEIDMPTATPLLNPLAAQGDAANPQMGIRWFCSPVGIERFQVLVSLLPGALPSVITPDIAADSATHPYMLAPNPAKPLIKRDFAIYETPAPGLNFGPGPEFNLVVPINLGVKYTVQIRTVAKGGSVSKSSKFQTFLWKAPPKAVGPEVPWPQAPLAALGDTPSTVYAQRLADSVYPGVGVTIGKIIRQQLASNTNGTLRPNLKTTVKSSDIVFKDDQGDSLFPLALYRYQVASAGFPKVSRDLTQVTPMMESIALTPGFDTFQQPCMNWKEPFALMVNASSEKLFNPVFLLDTQPVIHGARYVYLLVRFGDDGEPKEILPTPPVDILP
jgi:hypothetical protein